MIRHDVWRKPEVTAEQRVADRAASRAFFAQQAKERAENSAFLDDVIKKMRESGVPPKPIQL